MLLRALLYLDEPERLITAIINGDTILGSIRYPPVSEDTILRVCVLLLRGY